MLGVVLVVEALPVLVLLSPGLLSPDLLSVDPAPDDVSDPAPVAPALVPAPAALPAAVPVAGGLPPLLRKSVTYQPDPFNWNPAAETSFRRSGLWQAGHSVSGASDSFCSASSSCPQDAHRYS